MKTIRKNTIVKSAAFIMSLALIFAVPIPVSANEITSSGGTATVPVSLTTTNSGIDDDCKIIPTKLSVVVPTTLSLKTKSRKGLCFYCEKRKDVV